MEVYLVLRLEATFGWRGVQRIIVHVHWHPLQRGPDKVLGCGRAERLGVRLGQPAVMTWQDQCLVKLRPQSDVEETFHKYFIGLWTTPVGIGMRYLTITPRHTQDKQALQAGTGNRGRDRLVPLATSNG